MCAMPSVTPDRERGLNYTRRYESQMKIFIGLAGEKKPLEFCSFSKVIESFSEWSW
jgi:hypothetical protein